MTVSQFWLRSTRLVNRILAGLFPFCFNLCGGNWFGSGRSWKLTAQHGWWLIRRYERERLLICLGVVHFFVGELLGEITRFLCDFEVICMKKEVGESDFANLRSPFCKKPFLKFERWVSMPKLIKIAKCESSRLRIAVDPDHLQLLDESDPLWVEAWKTLWNSQTGLRG